MIAPERTGGKPLLRAKNVAETGGETGMEAEAELARPFCDRERTDAMPAAFWTIGITRSLSES
jgi:hypothetical protein